MLNGNEEIENKKKAAFFEKRGEDCSLRRKTLRLIEKFACPVGFAIFACRFARPTCFPSDVLRKFLLTDVFQKFREIFFNFEFRWHNIFSGKFNAAEK